MARNLEKVVSKGIEKRITSALAGVVAGVGLAMSPIYSGCGPSNEENDFPFPNGYGENGQGCQEGQRRCDGDDILVCNNLGEWWNAATCEYGCVEGHCIDEGDDNWEALAFKLACNSYYPSGDPPEDPLNLLFVLYEEDSQRNREIVKTRYIEDFGRRYSEENEFFGFCHQIGSIDRFVLEKIMVSEDSINCYQRITLTRDNDSSRYQEGLRCNPRPTRHEYDYTVWKGSCYTDYWFYNSSGPGCFTCVEREGDELIIEKCH